MCNLYVMASMPPSYFDASGTSNAMLDELAERPPMSQLAGMKHTYIAIVYSHTFKWPRQYCTKCNSAVLCFTSFLL